MVNFLLGQQSGFTKYPCFLCMWDSRDTAQHYLKKDWPVHEELVPCRARNVINNLLADRDKILFPLLHIKLGLIKQFTKALDKDGGCFTYLCHAFPGLTIEKLKAGIFDCSQIRQLIRDPEFENSMNEVELEAWKAFVLVVKNLATTRPGTMQNLSPICWLLSETLDATWASKCITYSHIWIGFLRIWVQWVMRRGRDSIRT